MRHYEWIFSWYWMILYMYIENLQTIIYLLINFTCTTNSKFMFPSNNSWRGSVPSIFVFRLISYSTPKRQNIFIKCQRLWYITAPIFRQEPTTQEQQTNKITNVKRPCYNFSEPVLFLALIHSKWINRQHAVMF